MSQDFTVKKKQYLSEKKKIRAEGFTRKKNSCTSSERKKKFVQAEKSLRSRLNFAPNGNEPNLMLSLIALLTLGLFPYEMRILTILQVHLKSPLHATGRPNDLARKKELAMFLSSGELVRLTTAVALGILGNK